MPNEYLVFVGITLRTIHWSGDMSVMPEIWKGTLAPVASKHESFENNSSRQIEYWCFGVTFMLTWLYNVCSRAINKSAKWAEHESLYSPVPVQTSSYWHLSLSLCSEFPCKKRQDHTGKWDGCMWSCPNVTTRLFSFPLMSTYFLPQQLQQ
jgi:hypothetical protein